MSQFSDELSNFYGGNEQAWKNVQMYFASRSAYLLTRSSVLDLKRSLESGKLPDTTESAVLLTTKRIAWAHVGLLSVQNMFAADQHRKEIKLLKEKREQQKKARDIIRDRRDEREKKYGEIKIKSTDGGEKTILAQDRFGNVIREAMILYYEGEQDVLVQEFKIGGDGKREDTSNKDYETKFVTVYDLAPKISVQSAKNLILTTVQGRDYTRKELVSGGDLVFNVSGSIVSNVLDDYPSNDVDKFISIMEYGGIVYVNNMKFDQLNVDRLLIKDWRLDSQECKNIQPYSFTCVAVEPDTDVVVVSDTIDLINSEIASKGEDRMVNKILGWGNRAAGYDFSLADILSEVI